MATGKRILYFIAGTSPTKDEELAAAKLNTRMFRNVQFASETTNLEVCDAVAGMVPESYAAKYPVATKIEDVLEPEKKSAPQSPAIAPQPTQQLPPPVLAPNLPWKVT